MTEQPPETGVALYDGGAVLPNAVQVVTNSTPWCEYLIPKPKQEACGIHK